MNAVASLIETKKWDIDSETKERLISVVDKFTSNRAQPLELNDLKQFSSYFVTHVYKLECTQAGLPVNFYAKFAYLPKEYEKRQRERIKYEYDCTVQIQNLFEQHADFGSVKAEDYFHQEAAFVMSEMPGERLDEMLVASMRPFSSYDNRKLYKTMYSAGQWLSLFQKDMPVKGETCFTRQQLEQRIADYLGKVDHLDSSIINPALRASLVKQTTHIVENIQAKDLVISAKHNDYAPWNLMGLDTSVIGFDYADIEYDSIYYDVYHFTRALNSFKLKPIKKTKIIDACKRHFLQGYGLDIPLDHPTRIYFNIFFSLERLQMLLRAKQRNRGLIGKLRTLSQQRHINWYLAELKQMAER